MKNRLRLPLIALCACLVMGASLAGCGGGGSNENTAPQSRAVSTVPRRVGDLTFTLSAPKTTFKVDEDMMATFTVTNVGRKPVLVYYTESRESVFGFFDQNGPIRNYEAFTDSRPSNPVTYAPGQTRVFSMGYKLSDYPRGYWAKPGHYRMIGWIDAAFTDGFVTAKPNIVRVGFSGSRDHRVAAGKQRCCKRQKPGAARIAPGFVFRPFLLLAYPLGETGQSSIVRVRTEHFPCTQNLVMTGGVGVNGSRGVQKHDALRRDHPSVHRRTGQVVLHSFRCSLALQVGNRRRLAKRVGIRVAFKKVFEFEPSVNPANIAVGVGNKVGSRMRPGSVNHAVVIHAYDIGAATGLQSALIPAMLAQLRRPL